MRPPPPAILTAHLFPELDARLLELMRSLEPADWDRPTIVPAWNVRQIAAHLLDTALRRLSFGRDGWRLPAPPIRSDRDLVAFINDLNARGVTVLGALSPQVLTDLTAVTVTSLHEYLASLDPQAEAAIGVSWAGEQRSAVWFDVARELTERWHHQQQMWFATGREGILTERLYRPVLDCFMRGAPHAYRDLDAPPGTIARVVITGPGGGAWHLEREPDRWALVVPDNAVSVDASHVSAETIVPGDLAWRLFTKSLSREQADASITVTGDQRVGRQILRMVAIVG